MRRIVWITRSVKAEQEQKIEVRVSEGLLSKWQNYHIKCVTRLKKDVRECQGIMLIKKKDEMSVSPETLSFSEYREKHEVGIATIVKHYDWVKAKSRDIDIEKELPLARDLDKIMRYFREKHTFVGVSSNNIYWNVTRIPIRQILVPAPKRQYITLINPKIMKLEGEDNHYVEACGSIPGKIYAVKRKSYVSISGFTLEKQYIDLEYGSKKYYSGGELIYSAYSHQEWIIQHEMDHLDGITIADKATKLIWEFS